MKRLELRLPPKQNQILIMSLRGMTQKDIADSVGYSHSYVHAIMNKIRRVIKDIKLREAWLDKNEY